MFTIKFYGGGRQRILSAKSFTILRDGGGHVEITLHQENQNDDRRIDISDAKLDQKRDVSMPEVFDYAVIENMAGKTTEVIRPNHF